MTKNSTEHTADPALLLDMLAALMATTGTLIAGLELLGRFMPGCARLHDVAGQLYLGTDWDTAWEVVAADPDLTELGEQLRFLHFTAVPTATVLQASASALRRNRKRRAEQKAAELAIRLVIPMGTCLLPAFICLGVIPMMISLFPR